MRATVVLHPSFLRIVYPRDIHPCMHSCIPAYKSDSDYLATETQVGFVFVSPKGVVHRHRQHVVFSLLVVIAKAIVSLRSMILPFPVLVRSPPLPVVFGWIARDVMVRSLLPLRTTMCLEQDVRYLVIGILILIVVIRIIIILIINIIIIIVHNNVNVNFNLNVSIIIIVAIIVIVIIIIIVAIIVIVVVIVIAILAVGIGSIVLVFPGPVVEQDLVVEEAQLLGLGTNQAKRNLGNAMGLLGKACGIVVRVQRVVRDAPSLGRRRLLLLLLLLLPILCAIELVGGVARW